MWLDITFFEEKSLLNIIKGIDIINIYAAYSEKMVEIGTSILLVDSKKLGSGIWDY
jgi:hypothetical protein